MGSTFQKTATIKNINKNIIPVSNILNSKDLLTKKHNEVNIKLEEYSSRYNILKKSVDELKKQERKIIERKVEINDNKKPHRSNILSRDIEHTKQTRDLELKLQRITDAKKELFRNVVSLRVKYYNLLLQIDSIVFDIIVMTETITNKIKHMSQL